MNNLLRKDRDQGSRDFPDILKNPVSLRYYVIIATSLALMAVGFEGLGTTVFLAGSMANMATS